MIKKMAILVALCYFFLSVHGQNVPELQIGDQVPDFTITNTKNFDSECIRFSQLKNKLIIIDFWNQWCAACINGMPKMQKLKQKFGDQIEILLVTEQSKEELKPIFARSPILRSTTLPFIFSDTIFHKLFPHKANPYHVWIDESGILRVTTGGWNTTETTVGDFLSGKNVSLEIRVDQMNFDLSKSFLSEGQGRLINYIQSYSLFIPNKIKETPKSMVSVLNDSITNQINGMHFLNNRILDLFAHAYQLSTNSKIVVELPNASDYYEPTDLQKRTEWHKRNIVCYEFRMPAHLLGMNAALKWMQADLYRYFGLEGKYEKRNMKCWILYKRSAEDKLKSKGGEPLSEMTLNGLVIRNVPFQVILNTLSTHFAYGPNYPILIDSTGYSDNIDITLPLTSFNPDERPSIFNLNKSLLPYGLEIREEIKNIPVLVLMKKN